MNKTESEFIENVLQSYVGNINDSATRASITAELSNGLSSLRSIVCDETNNPPSVVESCKLIVYVDYTKITISYDGVDFNEKA